MTFPADSEVQVS